MTKTAVLSLIALSLSCATASAQVIGGFGTPAPVSMAPHHSSTAAEGYLRGAADVIRSKGYFNEATSRAAINLQEAYRLHLDNKVKKVHTYFEKRQLNASYRQASRRPIRSSEALARIAKQGVPARVTPSQLDPTFAAIHWPETFDAACLLPLRAEMDGLFADRLVVSSGVGSKNYQQIRTAASQMKRVLRDHIVGKIDPATYIAARHFVESLANEARYQAAPAGLAAK